MSETRLSDLTREGSLAEQCLNCSTDKDRKSFVGKVQTLAAKAVATAKGKAWAKALVAHCCAQLWIAQAEGGTAWRSRDGKKSGIKWNYAVLPGRLRAILPECTYYDKDTKTPGIDSEWIKALKEAGVVSTPWLAYGFRGRRCQHVSLDGIGEGKAAEQAPQSRELLKALGL